MPSGKAERKSKNVKMRNYENDEEDEGEEAD